MTVSSFGTIRERAGDYSYIYNMQWGAADQNALGLLNMNIDRIFLFAPPKETALTNLER